MSAAPELESLLAGGAPGLGAGPRPGVIDEAAVRALAGAVAAGTDARRRELVTGVALLWHDHLDAAHRIAQEHEDADGSFLHAVMHRREGDFANSAWWWRRVGRHPVFPELAAVAAAIGIDPADAGIPLRESRAAAAGAMPRDAVEAPTGWRSQLHRHVANAPAPGRWDPEAFIARCRAAVVGGDDATLRALVAVQACELTALAAWLLAMERPTPAAGR